ncbi:MAG: hypothetical protein KJ871_12125, partial [Alphaproteobacteria bacterium]|nr:hypothetical protein [Alphaproteobacteria bacterium]
MSKSDPALGQHRPRGGISRRARDFFILGFCFCGVLFLLAATGELDFVVAFAAMAVLASVAFAYFVGSAAFLPVGTISRAAPAPDIARRLYSVQLLRALPLPAFEVDGDRRIVAFNESADLILRLDGRINPRASTVI